MAKPRRTCYGKDMCIHIGPCCDFWADDGMCVCNPADAAEYQQSQRLYVGVNIRGFSSPNIRTVFPDGTDHVLTFNRGDYCSAYWNWGTGYDNVTFQLRDGGTVRAVRSTRIMGPNMCSVEGEYRDEYVCPCGTKVFKEVCHDGKWVRSGVTCPDKITYKGVTLEWLYRPAGDSWGWGWRDDEFSTTTFVDLETAKHYIDTRRMCGEGEKRAEETCWDTSVIQKEVCRDNRWVATGEKCPPMPADGALRKPTTCWDRSVIYAEIFDANLKWWVATGEKCPVKVCSEGEKRGKENCWDGSVIYKEVCRGNKWVPTGEACIPRPETKPTETCNECEKRGKENCWDGSVIYKEVCRDNRWIATGEKCPPMPADGALRKPTTCWDRSVIYAEIFDANLKWWVTTNEKCPVKVCSEGEKRGKENCWDGSVIYKEVCRGNKWVPTGEACIPRPECSAGDKKAGYVCVNGKWQIVPVAHEVPLEAPCLIKFDIPLLDMLPGIPCQWWLLPVLPGFKIIKKSAGDQHDNRI